MYNKRNCFRSIEPKLPPTRTNRLLSGKSDEAPRGLDYSKQSAVKIIVDAARERSPSSVILFPWSGKMAGQNKELGMTLFTRLDCFKKRRRSSIAAGVPTGVTKKNWKNGKSRERAKERRVWEAHKEGWNCNEQRDKEGHRGGWGFLCDLIDLKTRQSQNRREVKERRGDRKEEREESRRLGTLDCFIGSD